MKNISSRQNQEIMSIAKLADAKERASQGLFIAEGLRTYAALIESPLKLVQLYVLPEFTSQAEELTDINKITVVNKAVMDKISQASTPSGLLGVFRIPRQYHLSQLTPGLVMARISDPGNMGTLIRTCAALGIKSIVTVEGADPWGPKVIQASAGTIGLVNIYTTSWQELVAQRGSLELTALVVHGGNAPTAQSLKNALLVVGSEAHGIPTEWLNDCNTTMTLPMLGNVESLNAAVAASIALYMMTQQIAS